jgi:hypothetical protein
MNGETKPPEKPAENPSEFELASAEDQPGFFRELLDFLIHHAAWWLTPIVVVLLLLGVLLLLSGSAVAPFIYPLF